MIFKIPFWIQNSGDGSVQLCLEPTLTKAQEEDESQSEGWGESSAGMLKFKIEDNKISYQTYKLHEGFVWVEVSQ